MADKVLFNTVAIAMAVGILASYSLSAYIVRVDGQQNFHYFLMQLSSALIALFVMWGVSRLEAKGIAKLAFIVFGVSFLAMVAMPFLPASVVPLINGAKRWIRLGISIAPVEFFKIGFIYFLAWSFSRKFYLQERQAGKREFILFIPYLIILMVVMVLVVILQNDLGQAIVLGVVVLLMLLFAGGSLRLFGILSSGAALFGIIFIASSGYRRTKVLQWYAGIQDKILTIFPDSVASFLRVDTNAIDQGYQVLQASNAMAHGGFMGVGIGGGTLKLGFVSDIHTDFVLAGIIEETGIFGALVVSALLLGVIHRILKIANRTENAVHYLFSIGMAVMLAVQFAMNALGIVGIAPVKGITVPFISYGGSSLVALAVGMGMLLAMSKDKPVVIEESTDQKPSQTMA